MFTGSEMTSETPMSLSSNSKSFFSEPTPRLGEISQFSNYRRIPKRQKTMTECREFISKMRENQSKSSVFGSNETGADYKTTSMQDYRYPRCSADGEDTSYFPDNSRTLDDAHCWKSAQEVKNLQDLPGRELFKFKSFETRPQKSLYNQDYSSFIYGRPKIQGAPRQSNILVKSRQKLETKTYDSFYRHIDSGHIREVFNENCDLASQHMLKNTTSQLGSIVWNKDNQNSSKAKFLSMNQKDFLPPPKSFESLSPVHAPLTIIDPITQTDVYHKNSNNFKRHQEFHPPSNSEIEVIWENRAKAKLTARNSRESHFYLGNYPSYYDTEHMCRYSALIEE